MKGFLGMVANAGVCLALLAMVSGCATLQTVNSDNATWQDLALATCQDLQTASAGASAAVAWARVYYPDRDELFKAKVDPVLVAVIAGTDAYCTAAQTASTVDGMSGLLAKKAEVVALMDKLAVLIDAVKAL